MEQDRALESQRLAEIREQAASEAAQRLTSLLSDPGLLTTAPGEGALLAQFPGARLMFRPASTSEREISAEAFLQAESHEFREGGLSTAADEYRRLSRSPDAAIRSLALLRLGRTQLKAGRTEEALRGYNALARMETATVEGWPAPIAAVWSRCMALESASRRADLRREGLRLRQMLLDGVYALSKSSYTIFADDAARWTGLSRPTDRERLTDAVNSVHAEIREARRAPSGRGVISVDGMPITVIWGQSSRGLAVFAATRAYVEREWLSKAGGVWLGDEHGHDLGKIRPGKAAMRYAMETGLPWTVLAGAPDLRGDFGARRKLLIVLLGAVGLFTVAGSYVVLSAFRREFLLARMQQDFVAAVSHEFRTPLTMLRQIAEVLEDGRVTGEDRRRSYYQSLTRATQRLHRLVEDLLDFRRMQSGAFEYKRAAISAAELTLRIVTEFQREVEDRGFQVVGSSAPDVHLVADGEAIGRALWNLLDNAVKYSGSARSVDLEVNVRDQAVVWSVRDHGIGIPANEKSLVFQKFYRGEHARRAGIRGTGIGLAMVQQIVAAHGGKLSVTSEPGVGSVFTMSIPGVEPNGAHPDR